jgi:diguanylate cyclase (GGDEF)-like protein
MQSIRLNLEDFPDSAHARELRHRRMDLRFESSLEAEYIIWHLMSVRLRVRVWFSINVVLAAFFATAQARHTGIWSVASLLHIGGIVPCAVALAWLSWSPYYRRLYMPAARVLVPTFGALIALFVAIGVANGQSEELAALAVNLIGVLFFSGLLYREALITSAVMLIVFVAAAVAAGLPQLAFLKSVVVLTLTSVIGAIVFMDVERSYRIGFLEAALIGDLVARDSLSGLMNRRAFDEHLLRVWQHALRDRRSMALLMIDIDHFKEYNDAAGHQAGDLALRSVARTVQGFARRPLDLAARYGGEEFAVILYDLPIQHVQDTAERIRHMVENLGISPMGAHSGPQTVITVSIGVSCFVPMIGRTVQGSIQLADEALYEAKEAGRNRVIVKGEKEYLLLDTGVFKGAKAS